MKKGYTWASWSIATKISALFLGLSVLSMSIVGYLAFTTIRDQGNYAIETIVALGENVTEDSTSHLVRLGEEIIRQKAHDVASQVEMYLSNKPKMSVSDMRGDRTLHDIIVQPVGITGYTTLIDPNNAIIVVHKFPELEKDLSPLREALPTFWSLMLSSRDDSEVAGYYDWQEVDGRIRQKYACIVAVRTIGGGNLTLWATTYITEFSQPAEETKKEIGNAIRERSVYINRNVSDIQDLFLTIFVALLNVVVGLSLLLSWFITSPIKALKRGAEAIGQGNLGFQLEISSKDELGDLAQAFNLMAIDLRSSMDALKKTAEENLSKERSIQENLRLYVQKTSEAQEAERKRIARDLHDETAQALVVVTRHLDELSAGSAKYSPDNIRDEVKKVLEGVRRFSQELRPSILDDLGLVPAVKWMCSEMTKNYPIAVDSEIIGSPRQLPPQMELMLFRIVQEALNNVRKHSRAKKASVQVEFTKAGVKLTISDNGVGFLMPSKMSDLAVVGRLGLTGVQERVQLLGGLLRIESQPGSGTRLSIEVKV